MTLAAPLDLLKQARARFTQREIAAHVGKDIKTVRRWEKGETPCPSMLEPALRDLLHSSGRTKAGAAKARVPTVWPSGIFKSSRAPALISLSAM